jgi:Ca2+-binding EF-hand superfamily protein
LKDDLIKKLDEALLEIRASPSLLFREADSDRDGTVSMRELSVTLAKLGIQLDEVLLRNIFN